jgi:MFS family permease
MTIIAYSQQFLASTYARTWGWKVEDYAFVNGVALLAIAPATVFAMGWLSDRWMKGGLKEAPFRLLTIGFLLMLPTGIIPYFMPTGELAFAAHCVNTVGIAMVSAVNVNALLLITPAPIRGQVVALFYVAISLSGLLLGPTTVGALSTRVFGEENIRWAMACVPAIFGVVPLLILPVARRLYLRQLARIGAAST